jgi:hypothetical protein
MNANITTMSVHVSNICIVGVDVMYHKYLFCSLLMLMILLQEIPWLSPNNALLYVILQHYESIYFLFFFADKGYIS